MKYPRVGHKVGWAVLAIPALLALASCTTSGGNIFGDAAPKDGDQQPGQTANASPGTNPNASSIQKNTYTKLSDYCPTLRIRSGTEALRVYKKGSDRENPNNVRYQATITKIARECHYVGESLEITIGARGKIITGPAGKSGDFRMPIRVAIQEGSCSHHFSLHQQAMHIPAGSAHGKFQFVGGKIIIPAPKELNVRMYIGFDEGPYGKPSTQNCN
ncbi:MAG: hypothetical protein V3V02_02610 [Rhizobiaceae bacterium]